MVHGFAFVNRLKEIKPDAAVDWVVSDVYSDLVDNLDGVGRTIPFRRSAWGRNWWKPSTLREIASFILDIRKSKYDVCLDLQGLFRSGVIAWLSGAKLRAGFADAREGSRYFYQKYIEPPLGKSFSENETATSHHHAVDKIMQALKLFDVPVPERADFSFTIPPQVTDAAKRLIKEAGIEEYAVFHVGARWKTKMWPENNWREFAGRFQSETGIPVVFTGSPTDSAIVERIISGLSGRFLNFCGKGNLIFLSAILKGAKMMVTVDSGPMHLASAFNIPIVSLFGPTSPEKTGPITGGKNHNFQVQIDCAPCFKKGCEISPNCMDMLTPQSVMEKIPAYFNK